MARGYTAEKFLKIVERIRERVPDAAITADAIVGFPGETEEQFQNTLKLMEAVKFDQLNTAAYSPRPHTPAAMWEEQVDESVKKERLQIINRLAKEHAYERRLRYLDTVVEVLVEKRNPKDPNQVRNLPQSHHNITAISLQSHRKASHASMPFAELRRPQNATLRSRGATGRAAPSSSTAISTSSRGSW